MNAIAGAREVVRGSGCPRSNRRARAAADGYWGLVAAGEPFRLLFPLGTVIGVFGVMMWPLFVWCEGFGYPGVPHARIMIEGFLGCFVAGFASEGRGVRAAAFVVYFFHEVPVHRAGWGGGSLAFGLRIALFAIPVGYLLAALMPARAIALMHVVFITGFGLLALIVATRVVLGHSGQSEKFQSALWPVKILCGLIVLAMLTRVSADWMPKVQTSHYAYAALAWIAGVLVWSAFILPGVTRADAK